MANNLNANFVNRFVPFALYFFCLFSIFDFKILVHLLFVLGIKGQFPYLWFIKSVRLNGGGQKERFHKGILKGLGIKTDSGGKKPNLLSLHYAQSKVKRETKYNLNSLLIFIFSIVFMSKVCKVPELVIID